MVSSFLSARNDLFQCDSCTQIDVNVALAYRRFRGAVRTDMQLTTIGP